MDGTYNKDPKIRVYPAGRDTLATLFKGVGAEIGVERGKFSKEILFTADKLYCVDLWKNYPGYREHVSDAEYEEIFEDCQKRLEGRDVVFVRLDSIEASKNFPDDGLDFLYLDGNHTYESVSADTRAWYPKVRPGGIIAGHDWVKKKDFGVIKAILDFCKEIGIEEITTWNGDSSPSFHFIKPKA